MKSLPTLALLLASQLSTPAAPDLETLMPENTVMVATSASYQTWFDLADHPVIKLLPSQKMTQDYFAFIKSLDPTINVEAQMKAYADALGKTPEDLWKVPGQAILTLHDLHIPDEVTPENFGLEFSYAIHLDVTPDQFEKLSELYLQDIKKSIKLQANTKNNPLTELTKDIQTSETTYQDIKIQTLKITRPEGKNADIPHCFLEWNLAFHDKTLLIASGENTLRDLIDRLKTGKTEKSLLTNPFYKKMLNDTGDQALLRTSIHLTPILELAQEKIRKEMEKGALNTPAVNPLQAWAALGIDKLQTATFTMQNTPDSLDSTWHLTYSEKPGLLSWLVLDKGTPPHFLPDTLTSATYNSIDIPKTLNNLEKLIGEISPMGGAGYLMGLGEAKKQTGVDLRKDLLDQLGPDNFTAQLPTTPDPHTTEPTDSAIAAMGLASGNQVIGIKLKDSNAFQLAVKTIINKLAPEKALFHDIDYNGVTIHRIKDIPEPLFVGYAITADWLLIGIGKRDLLEQILAKIQKPQGDGYFAQKFLTTQLDKMRDGQINTSASDFGSTIIPLIELMTTSMGTALDRGGKETAQLTAILDYYKTLPKALKIPAFTLSKMWLEDQAAEIRIRITPKE